MHCTGLQIGRTDLAFTRDPDEDKRSYNRKTYPTYLNRHLRSSWAKKIIKRNRGKYWEPLTSSSSTSDASFLSMFQHLDRIVLKVVCDVCAGLISGGGGGEGEEEEEGEE